MHSAKKWLCCQKSKSADSDNENPIPIDRGWAWVIVAASAGLFCLITGTFKCFGLLKLEIQTNFVESDESVILWMLSTCSIVSLLSGVVFSWILNRTSHRTVGLIGGSICSLGIFITAFAPNVHFMFLSLGLIYSFGTGGVIVVVFSAFADYFSKHRGLAVGIMASGSGLGSLVIPKLLNYLFDIYPFREALICYAGVFLQSLFLAALLRPSSYYKISKNQNTEQNDSDDKQPTDIDGEEQEKFLTNISLPDEMDDDNSLPKSDSAETMFIDETLCSVNASQPSLLLGNNNKLPAPDNTTAECALVYGSNYSSLGGPFLSTLTLNDIDNSNKQMTTATSNPAAKTSSCFKNTSNVANYNWKLWCNSQVLVIGTLVFFAVNSINLIFTTAPSFAKENHVEVDVVTTIMTLAGTGEIVCRMIHGWLADRRIISALTQICLIMFVCTVAALLCAFLHGVVGIAIMYAVMSLCGTTIYSLLPIVIIEQIGKESLVTVLGIFYVYQAMAFVVSTLVANELHSRYDTWVYVFYYIGACYFMALAIGVISHICYRIKMRRMNSLNRVIDVQALT